MSESARTIRFKYGKLDVTVTGNSPSDAAIKEASRILREKIDAMPAQQKTGTEG